MKKFTVHNLEPMTLSELADLSCGHCRHRLSWHVTKDNGATFCSACHCLRHSGEDIMQPHNFRAAAGGAS